MTSKDEIRMKELIRMGQDTAHSQIHFYLSVEKYRRQKLFEKDRFKIWGDALESLLKKIRRSRSGVMAKLSQVRLLLDTNKVSYADLEQIGDANATLLCRLYRAKGLNAAWIKRAKTWEVEKFKAAVLKLVKPKEEPKRHLTFVVVQSLHVEVMAMIGRIQTLAKLNTKEGALEFIVADYLTKEDHEILHQASENPELAERMAKVQRRELSATSKSKATKSRHVKDGNRSRIPTPAPAKRKSKPSGNGSTSSASGTSSPANPDGESRSSNAQAEQTTTPVN
jgi:hypothetical protein